MKNKLLHGFAFSLLFGGLSLVNEKPFEHTIGFMFVGFFAGILIHVLILE